MGATKITAIVKSDFNEDDTIAIVRVALVRAGLRIEIVEANSVIDNAVLYMETTSIPGRSYVMAIPSRGKTIEWTEDIDSAKVCNGIRSIEVCKREVEQRTGFKVEVLAV